MSLYSSLSSCNPELRGLLPLPVFRYIREYNCFHDARRFAAMNESDVPLTIRGRKNIARVTAGSVWVKRWLHCYGRGMSLYRWVSTAADMPFFHCYEAGEYDWTL